MPENAEIAQLQKLALALQADVGVLRYAVASLVATEMTDENRRRLIEALHFPVDSGMPGANKLVYEAIERFVKAIEKHMGSTG